MSVWFWISVPEPSSSVNWICILNISTTERNHKKHLEISRRFIWLDWRLGSARERFCLGLRHASELSEDRTDRQTTMHEYTYDCCLCYVQHQWRRSVSTPLTWSQLFMNKLRAYLVYLKWRNKLKHRDGSLFYCWQSVPIKLSKLMRKVASEFVEREKDSRLSVRPESVTMTDTIAFESEWRRERLVLDYTAPGLGKVQPLHTQAHPPRVHPLTLGLWLKF